MKKIRLRPLLAGSAAFVLLAVLFGRPAQCVAGVRAGLACCTEQVLPSLFPFFVVCPLVLSSPLAGVLGAAFWPYTRFVLGIRSPRAGAALLLSWLGGFAVAARLIGELHEQGVVSRRQAHLLILCGVGSSPAFVVNTVGFLLLGSARAGWCLFAALSTANLCAGALGHFLLSREAERRPVISTPAQTSQADFVGAVQGAVQSSLTVCGFVVFFSFLHHVLADFLCAPVPKAAAAALLEVTGGCIQAAALPGAAALYACCAALSLQSLSVLLQVRALLPGEISLVPLVLLRPVHLLVSLAALRFLLGVIPGAVPAANSCERLIVQSRTAPDTALVLFALCCTVLYVLPLQAKRKRV